MKKVSVIIPYYNTEKTIIRALESVVNQTFIDYEIILVDDGSSDDGHIFVDNYIRNHKHISFKHYYQKNTGPSEARNLAIREARGNYIAFLDADDSWINNKLHIQMKLISGNKIDLLGSNVNLVKENGKIVHKYFIGSRQKVKYISFHKLLFKHYFNTSSVIVSKKVLEDVGGFPEKQKYAEDTLLFSRITRKYRSAVTSEFLVNTYKPLFGESGLSANLKGTHKYVINNIRLLKDENTENKNKIGYLLYSSVLLFAYLKYFRKVFISFLRKMKYA